MISRCTVTAVLSSMPTPSKRRPSLLRLLEISQIRRQLVLLGGHQEAVRAQQIVFRADEDVVVAVLAPGFGPLHRLFGKAHVLPVGGPRPRQGMVDHGGKV